jgi:transcriptional repressor NrdR
MRCPKCNFHDSKVVDSRPGKNEASIRRRRECLKCGHRFSTVEEVLKEDLVIIKRDGSREEFDRTKIFRGISKAFEKRPMGLDQIESLVQEITAAVQTKFDSEVSSKQIGEEIMERLKRLDQIAYVRFASVYKDFHDISQLAQEIKSLKQLNSNSANPNV